VSALATANTSVTSHAFVTRRISVRRFDVSDRTPGHARRHTAETLSSWDLVPLIETAELLVSELVTNACRATAGWSSPSSVVAVRLTATDADLFIEVWDANEAAPVCRDPEPDTEDGRGLLLVEALSARWSWYRPPANTGKVVWCSLLLPRSVGLITGDTEPLPRRPASSVTVGPVDSFDDLAVLQRVADGLRALDWELPPGDGTRP
jgi:anti-sigma regulatory factor (Ser/Thr protein kinase)